MSEIDSLLTCGDAAKLLNRSTESVRAYERRGELPALKTSRGVRLFRESDVREFARKRAEKTQNPAA